MPQALAGFWSASICGKSAPGRRRLVVVPDPGELVADLGPDPIDAGVERVDAICPPTEENDVVGDDPAGCVAASLRVEEAQYHRVVQLLPALLAVPENRERVLVHLQRIVEATVPQEAEPPGSVARDPDETG